MLHPYVDILYHVVQYKILKPAQQRVLGLKGQYLKGKSKAKLKFPAQIREILHGECDKSMHIPWKNTLYTVQILYRKQCKFFEISLKKVKHYLHVVVAKRI